MRALLAEIEPRARWLLLLAALGVFLAADDQTSVVAVLPKIINDLGLPADRFYRASWIVNGYILGYIVAMPLMARLADRVGHGRVYALTLLLFVFGSAWVALANDITVLSIGRGVQAVGGGAVVPIAMAIAVNAAPLRHRALGISLMAAASEAGGLLGPLWGGGFAELAGWRSVFWINLPLCLPIVVLMWRISIPNDRLQRPGLDWAGSILAGLSLAALTVALTDDPIEPRAQLLTIALYGSALLAAVAFVAWEKRAAFPILEIGLLRDKRLSSAFVCSALGGGTLIVAMVGVPLYTNVVLEGSALDGGINLMRLTLGLPIGALIGGQLAPRWGLALVAAGGMVLAGVGFLGMSTWDANPGFVALSLPLFVAGIGFGLIIAPLNAAVFEVVREDERATYASLITVLRLIGALVGVSLLTTQGLGNFYTQAGLIPLSDPRFGDLIAGLQVETLQTIFLAAAVVSFFSALPCLLLGRIGGETPE